MSSERRSYRSTTPLYELHTFIFPSARPKYSAPIAPQSSTSSVSRYCFPISYSQANEFLYPQPPSDSDSDTPIDPAKESDPAHVNDWPAFITLQPKWVVAELAQFIEGKSRNGWLVGGLKFTDEAEEREAERKRRREQECKEQTREWEKLGFGGFGFGLGLGGSDEGQHSPGRTVYYGGVFYGCWYDDAESRAAARRGSWPEDEEKPCWFGSTSIGGNVIVGDGRRGDVKCQILMMKDE